MQNKSNFKSFSATIRPDVPQGSDLGPIYFLGLFDSVKSLILLAFLKF